MKLPMDQSDEPPPANQYLKMDTADCHMDHKHDANKPSKLEAHAALGTRSTQWVRYEQWME